MEEDHGGVGYMDDGGTAMQHGEMGYMEDGGGDMHHDEMGYFESGGAGMQHHDAMGYMQEGDLHHEGVGTEESGVVDYSAYYGSITTRVVVAMRWPGRRE